MELANWALTGLGLASFPLSQDGIVASSQTPNKEQERQGKKKNPLNRKKPGAEPSETKEGLTEHAANLRANPLVSVSASHLEQYHIFEMIQL